MAVGTFLAWDGIEMTMVVFSFSFGVYDFMLRT